MCVCVCVSSTPINISNHQIKLDCTTAGTIVIIIKVIMIANLQILTYVNSDSVIDTSDVDKHVKCHKL